MPREQSKWTFQEMNAQGCNYGVAWMVVNEAAADAASRYGLSPYAPGNKDKIMAIVLAVMDALNKRGVLHIPFKDPRTFILQSPVFLERELNETTDAPKAADPPEGGQ